MAGIEAFSSTLGYEFLDPALWEFGNELPAPKHSEDFAVHLQSIRRHQPAVSYIAAVGEGIHHRSEA